jgi:hypothetical protein
VFYKSLLTGDYSKCSTRRHTTVIESTLTTRRDLQRSQSGATSGGGLNVAYSYASFYVDKSTAAGRHGMCYWSYARVRA